MSEPSAKVDSAVEGLSKSKGKSKPAKDTPGQLDTAIENVSLDDSKNGNDLTKVDSAVAGVSPSSPAKARRTSRLSSSANKAPSRKDLYITRTPLVVSAETQKTGWKLNSSSSTVEDTSILDKPIVTPLVRNLDLIVDAMVIPVRSGTGVTIKDAMEAIHKKKKKVADEDFAEGKVYLKGFEWPPIKDDWELQAQDTYKKALLEKFTGKTPTEEQKQHELEEARVATWGTLIAHMSKVPEVSNAGGGKKKSKKGAAE